MTRWKISVEYDGSAFSGWQRQAEGVASVQETLEKALYKLSQEYVTCHGSGRTDAGVHARGQVVHFDLVKDFSAKSIIQGLNQHIGDVPVAVLLAEQVDDEFHARFSAKSRSYRYQILNRRSKLTLDRHRFWQVPYRLNVEAMQKGAAYLIGQHDFTSFRGAGCQSNSPLKTISSLNFSQQDDHIYMDIAAPSFLYHQVRNIIGTLVEVGRGKLKPEDIKKILEAKDRKKAGPKAPAEGLYFIKATY